jgi:hypothetical protein
MKYLIKRIVYILLGLSVIMMTGNVTAADVDASQAKGKMEIADYLSQADKQNVTDSMPPIRHSLSNQTISAGETCTSNANCSGAGEFCCVTLNPHQCQKNKSCPAPLF